MSYGFMLENSRTMNTLLINTTDSREIRVGLRIDGKEYFLKQKSDYRKAQVVLPLIEKILIEKHIRLKEVTSIEVNAGQGSFTGVRVGLSIANALGFSLKIPVEKVM